MKHDTDTIDAKIGDLRIIRHSKIEKLKHCIEDVLEWDFLHLTTDCSDGRELFNALTRLEKFYNDNKGDIR